MKWGAVECDAMYQIDDGGAFVFVINLDEGVGFATIGLGPCVEGECFCDLDAKVLPDEVV